MPDSRLNAKVHQADTGREPWRLSAYLDSRICPLAAPRALVKKGARDPQSGHPGPETLRILFGGVDELISGPAVRGEIPSLGFQITPPPETKQMPDSPA